ncbi:MAG: hypothetical protein U9Q15_02340 [Patescibacteria group bacterium]|nr:hypothetical protein [Patescibacteria group bacterium]
MGKSTILSNMIHEDIQMGRGVCVIDPHGDLADDALASVPKHRVKDVVLFDPSDRDNPVALNMFDNEDPNKKPLIASGIVAVLKKLNADSWGPRLEYILRNTTLALLDFPGSTFLGILRMYTDEYFRNRVVKEIQDPVVKRFWIEEFGKLEQKQILEQVGSIQNKVGQFLSNSIIRNILGQTKSSIDIRKIMDEGKILIVNLSKGKIGEDNATLLGSMLITKIQLDVMGRADMKEEDRKDFYLYVDEFQNFATDSFGTILSEARKYKLNLTMANQYVAQMPDSVRDAVFGNIGSMVTFQVGVDDTPLFVRQYGEQVTETDLMEIGKFKYYTRMLINGMPSNPFSVDALPPPRDEVDHNTIIEAIRYSRDNYTKKSSEVEEEIDSWEKKYEDPKKGEKEKKLADKKSAYEAKKAQLIKEGKWDPAGFNKKKNG